MNVCRTSVVQQAWREGRELTIHGLLYELADGLLRDTGIRVTGCQQIELTYERAVAAAWSVDA